MSGFGAVLIGPALSRFLESVDRVCVVYCESFSSLTLPKVQLLIFDMILMSNCVISIKQFPSIERIA